jgi:hypothetical protein
LGKEGDHPAEDGSKPSIAEGKINWAVGSGGVKISVGQSDIDNKILLKYSCPNTLQD